MGRDCSVWWNDMCKSNKGVWKTLNVYIVQEIYKDISSNFPSSSNPSWGQKLGIRRSQLKLRVWSGGYSKIGVATKDNLIKRGVSCQGSPACKGGCGNAESTSHLFFECPMFAGIWYSMCQWIGIKVTFHKESMTHLEQFLGLIELGRASSKIVIVIWFASIWNI